MDSISKIALITGTGQDASYLADQLILNKDYKLIVVMARRSSYDNLGKIRHLMNNPKFEVVYGDTTDKFSVNTIVRRYLPDEVYHLAAQSHVGLSFEMPQYTFESIVNSTTNLLEAIEEFVPYARFYHASSSEQFGDTTGFPIQDETTPFRPLSPYAIAKCCAHDITHYFRRTRNIKTYTGILFNHESPRRGEQFVTRKITKYIGQLVNKKTKQKLQLGDISTYRDWGYAPDYVNAMYLLLQQDEIDSVIVATGQTYEIQEFVVKAFNNVGLYWRDHVVVGVEAHKRPNEVKYLCGDPTKANEVLGWYPTVTFDDLISEMVEADVKAAS